MTLFKASPYKKVNNKVLKIIPTTLLQVCAY